MKSVISFITDSAVHYC